jgi:hypothetical protein
MAKQRETVTVETGLETAADNRDGTAVVFASVAEGRAAKPEAHPRWKLWSVTDPAGRERFVWADGIGHAPKQTALADGYHARCLDAKPVRPELIAGMLASMDAESRAALLAPYVAAGEKGK